jgi:DUF4097 and DUF4098 domain-containing protein YvlB
MKRTHSTAALLFAAVLGLTSLGWSQTQSGDEWRWSGKLSPDQLLQIKNVNGSVQADGINGDTIEVVATKSGDDRNDVHIEMVNSSEGITICAVFPGRGNSCEAGSDFHSNVHNVDAKVDFVVKLPRNLRFDGRTVNGKMRAENMARFVRGSAVNGSVTISTESWAQASSVNGGVRVHMGRADWDGSLGISTVNGSIDLELPSTLNTSVKFSSVNGSLDSDLPLTITHSSGRWGPKSVEGQIGSGGRALNVNTVNGSVHIRSGGAGL